MRKLILGNWKAYLGVKESIVLAGSIGRYVKNNMEAHEVGIAPSYASMQGVSEVIKDSGVNLCAQNFDLDAKDAHTGTVGIQVLQELGCREVILGHSEVRHRKPPNADETDELIASKVGSALSSEIRPILCVGESLEEKNRGTGVQVVTHQLSSVIDLLSDDAKAKVEGLVVAYEPTWAINAPGSKGVADVNEVVSMHKIIKQILVSRFGKEKAQKIRIFYGGGLDPNNIQTYIGNEEIDGLIVGRASTNFDSFTGMIR